MRQEVTLPHMVSPSCRPARAADRLRPLVIARKPRIAPRPAAFAAAKPALPDSGAASACAPGSVYRDRWARSWVMLSICPAASLSN